MIIVAKLITRRYLRLNDASVIEREETEINDRLSVIGKMARDSRKNLNSITS